MRASFAGLSLVTGTLLLTAWANAASTDSPVGLVLSSETPAARPGQKAPQPPGVLRRGRPEIGAVAGDLLFPGDRISAHDGSLELAFCPPDQTGARQSLSAGGAVTFARDHIIDNAGSLKDRQALPFCQLPQVDPEPEISSKGTSDPSMHVADPAAYTQRIGALSENARRELAALDTALHANPKDMIAMTSRAALLERNGLAAEAADQYATIAGTWGTQQWAKMLVQDDRRAAQPARHEAGTTYAVVIGISDYSDPSVKNLQFAHLDARRFKDYLVSDRGHKLPEDHIKLLTDRAATLPAINDTIKFLMEKARKNDTVLFFFSGHGAVAEGEGYLILPSNVYPKNLPDSAYPMSSLTALMYELGGKVGRFVLYIDACRSGTIGQITEKNLINPEIVKAVKGNPNADNIAALLASRETEPAWEHPNFGLGEGHSAFTYFLLRGMAADGVREADKDGDGKVSLWELFRYVQDEVTEATLHKQHPMEFSKIKDEEKEEVADLSQPGIKIAGWKPMPREAFENRVPKETGSASSAGGGITFPANEADLARLIQLEERGQEIMLRYLQGDEIPQSRDDFERGRQLYEQALALAPGSLYLESRKEFFWGRRLVFDKQYDDAIQHLETAIRLNPRSPSPYNALGIAYLELARYPDAIAAFEGAITRAWYWPYPRHNQALAYMQMGRYEPAILAYRKAIALAPEYSYLPYNLGLVFQKTHRFREAEDEYREAGRLADLRSQQPAAQQPAEAYAERKAKPLIALALLKADEGRSADAIRGYREALRTLDSYPGNKDILIARHDLALLLVKNQKSWTEAESLLGQNLDAGYVPSRQFMAEWLAERGKPAEAVPHFEALLAAEPQYTAARLELARQLEKLGDSARERAQLKLARQYDPKNPAVLLALARFESEQKQWGAAREAYQTALRYASGSKTVGQIRTALKRLP
jgi:tetratricopeptide (TPR) repeat protein